MFATLTSKGQLTLPKEIRDRLNLDAGAILDFQVQADNTITARHVQPDARRIRGLLKSPHAAPLTVGLDMPGGDDVLSAWTWKSRIGVQA